MINLKSKEEIDLMREGGKIASAVMSQVLKESLPGKTLIELDKLAEDLIIKAGGKPSFKMEKGYYWTTCMCLNDVVVHGIPTEEKLKEGDILCVDLGVFYKGFHADTSWTIIVGDSQKDSKAEKFLKTGINALDAAIKKTRVGNHIGDISQAMQKIVEGAGYSSVKQLVGHGVGKLLHEDPEVPCYVRGAIENTAEIKEGMVLAVEVIYNMGESPVVYKNEDGWTIVTRDGTPSAVFEHTVAVTSEGPKVLTA